MPYYDDDVPRTGLPGLTGFGNRVKLEVAPLTAGTRVESGGGVVGGHVDGGRKRGWWNGKHSD